LRKLSKNSSIFLAVTRVLIGATVTERKKEIHMRISGLISLLYVREEITDF
jgi:hypothetical protein